MKKVPAATINGKYSTYENSQKRDLVCALGHVVDLELEGLVSIEIGAWGTQLNRDEAKEHFVEFLGDDNDQGRRIRQ